MGYCFFCNDNKGIGLQIWRGFPKVLFVAAQRERDSLSMQIIAFSFPRKNLSWEHGIPDEYPRFLDGIPTYVNKFCIDQCSYCKSQLAES